MGSDLRIMEVGNNIISRYQLEWVEKSGPWNFDNNLLLSIDGGKIWGLPFENMIEEIGKDIGSKIGRVLEVDKQAMQADQVKF
ncbi:hypothetical protein CFP56_006340 [Quercus suber]|uniref:Uncharacterized protein n=1 Tax=Quercus suber TaxID=58331 RepID=A0AAW0LA30_QUESU